MPKDYANGKIYTIRSLSKPDLVYVGSTILSLSQRFTGHKTNFRKPIKWLSSFLVLEAGDAHIELLENYPCSNIKELRRREGHVQQSMVCVNHNVAGRTAEEWRVQTDHSHKYYKIHKSALRAKSRRQYHEHREAAIEYQKKYREANPEKAQKNKDDVKLRNSTRYECICGCEPLRGGRTLHERSDKHRQAAAVLAFILS